MNCGIFMSSIVEVLSRRIHHYILRVVAVTHSMASTSAINRLSLAARGGESPGGELEVLSGFFLHAKLARSTKASISERTDVLVRDLAPREVCSQLFRGECL